MTDEETRRGGSEKCEHFGSVFVSDFRTCSGCESSGQSAVCDLRLQRWPATYPFPATDLKQTAPRCTRTWTSPSTATHGTMDGAAVPRVDLADDIREWPRRRRARFQHDPACLPRGRRAPCSVRPRRGRRWRWRSCSGAAAAAKRRVEWRGAGQRSQPPSDTAKQFPNCGQGSHAFV